MPQYFLVNNMKNFDNSFLSDSVNLIAGIDEAGRGPLAGPVVAAAAVFSPDIYIEKVDDSKKLSAGLREELYDIIIKKAVCWQVAVIGHEEIDRINILQATLKGMKNALENLSVKPDLALIDGNQKFFTDIPAQTIVKGDSRSFAIAAASILAKVTRDRLMLKLAGEYPAYSWHKNKGYGTKEHIAAILREGPSPYHRQTFLRKIQETSNG